MTEATEAATEHRKIALDKAADMLLEISLLTSKVNAQIDRSDTAGAKQTATSAGNMAIDAMNILVTKAGVRNPLFVRAAQGKIKATTRGNPDPLDLSALATLDTEDSRELLRLLEAAQVVAEKIDRSRGKSLDESIQLLPGESHGTDLAESVSVLALRVRTEIHGKRGHGLE